VQPDDPFSIGGAILLLILCASLATYIPAARCARINPITALKYD
jgi:ABC-type antimicrobial peptide transport system permease subunit